MICMYVCMSVCLFVGLSVCLFIYLFIYLLNYLFTYLFIYLFIYLSIKVKFGKEEVHCRVPNLILIVEGSEYVSPKFQNVIKLAVSHPTQQERPDAPVTVKCGRESMPHDHYCVPFHPNR